MFTFIVSFFLSNKFTKIIYTDIQKAFDSVFHFRLIKTLFQHNIHNSLVNWFKKYLNGRTRIVVINNTFSKMLPVLSRVPQGGFISEFYL